MSALRPLLAVIVIGLPLWLAGCAGQPDAARDDSWSDVPPSQRLQLPIAVYTAPPGAQVFVNGRMIGSSPLQVIVETDRAGSLLEETEITADFSLLFSGETSQLTVVSQTLWRGDKPPRTMNFQPDAEVLRGR